MKEYGKRITIRIPETEYNKLKEKGNLSKVIREYLIVPQGVSNAQLDILLQAFDKVWDDVPIEKQKKLLREPIIKKAGEILDAIRNSQ